MTDRTPPSAHRDELEEAMRALCGLLEREFEPAMADPDASGAALRGAGDLEVHLHGRIEARRAGPAFFPLGRRSRELATRYGYTPELATS